MREASTGLLVELDPGSNVTDLLLEQHAKDPVHALYSRKGPAGWADVSAPAVPGPGHGPWPRA